MTNERKIRLYLDLLNQLWPNIPKDEQLTHAYTLGLSPATYSGSAATVRLDPLDARKWNLDAGMIEKHVAAFETFFALASINVNRTRALAAKGSNATLTKVGAGRYPNCGGETVGE